jgi:hypothetical protein
MCARTPRLGLRRLPCGDVIQNSLQHIHYFVAAFSNTDSTVGITFKNAGNFAIYFLLIY